MNNPFKDKKVSIQDAVEFYIAQRMRPIPVFGPDQGCKCSSEKCLGAQCPGKVPIDFDWFDHDTRPDDFESNNNIALMMGRQKDGRWLMAFDIDGDLDPEIYFNLPKTMKQKTPRGYHLIYEVIPDAPLGNWNDILMTRDKKNGYKNGFKGAIDIKFARGAIISAPSKHKSGKNYEWEDFGSPTQLPHETMIKLIKLRKKQYPKVKRYARWSASPENKHKRP